MDGRAGFGSIGEDRYPIPSPLAKQFVDRTRERRFQTGIRDALIKLRMISGRATSSATMVDAKPQPAPCTVCFLVGANVNRGMEVEPSDRLMAFADQLILDSQLVGPERPATSMGHTSWKPTISVVCTLDDQVASLFDLHVERMSPSCHTKTAPNFR